MHVENANPGSSLEIQHPGFLLGRVGSLCLSHTKILDSRGKAGVQHQLFCLWKQVRHNKPFLVLGVGGTSLKSEFLDTSQGPTLQAGLSRVGSQAHCVNPFLHCIP